MLLGTLKRSYRGTCRVIISPELKFATRAASSHRTLLYMFISDPNPNFDTKEDNAIIALFVNIGLLTPQNLILRSSEG